jgi:hypothetical protein
VEGLTGALPRYFLGRTSLHSSFFRISSRLTCAKYCNHLIRRANLPVYASFRTPSVSLLEKGTQPMKRRPPTNSSDSSLAWHSLYQAALFESDRAKIPNRIDAAERAILDRVKQLFRIEGDHIEEDQILDDALYALRALRNCVVPNVNAAA